eukprot:gene3835-7640_t
MLTGILKGRARATFTFYRRLYANFSKPNFRSRNYGSNGKKFLTATCLGGLIFVGMSTAEADSKRDLALSRNFIADAAESVAPSVVNILCPVHGMMISGVSSGSGFIISKEGYLVTNAHVVSQSVDGNVVVTLWDTRKFEGKVHSIDKISDIAIVKIIKPHGEDLPVAILGNSDKLRAGEFVVALGSPLFLQNSITFGIVSATARRGSDLGMDKNRTDFIQTDAAINIGNSGGPLVNLDGEVIGINTMKAQGTDGISFAIPIDSASVVIKQLLKHGRVIRPYIGCKMADYIPERGTKRSARGSITGLMSVDDVSVPMVMEVARGSPAHKAGLKSGDIVLEIDGKKISTVREVLDCIGLEVGRTLTLTVRRSSGNETQLHVTTAPEDSRY